MSMIYPPMGASGSPGTGGTGSANTSMNVNALGSGTATSMACSGSMPGYVYGQYVSLTCNTVTPIYTEELKRVRLREQRFKKLQKVYKVTLMRSVVEIYEKFICWLFGKKEK